jgi:hypothetical protein
MLPGRTGHSRWVACFTLSLIAAQVGCGASASFRDGVFDDGTVRYRVGMPGPGWDRIEVGDNDVAFNNRELGTISANSTCKEYEDVPEQALMNQLLFGTRERVFRTEETITLDGRGALHNVVDLELDGVPLTLEIFLLRKDGCVYDISRISSRPEFDRGRPALFAFVQGFHVLSTHIAD